MIRYNCPFCKGFIECSDTFSPKLVSPMPVHFESEKEEEILLAESLSEKGVCHGSEKLTVGRKREEQKPKSNGVCLKLIHGRENPFQHMDDWGTDGPIFGVYDWVHTTYAWDVKMGNNDGQVLDELNVHNGMIYYNRVWYGDWSVFPRAEHTEEHLTVFDEALAKLPDPLPVDPLKSEPEPKPKPVVGQLDYEAWIEKYKPVKNPNAHPMQNEYGFETFGIDFESVKMTKYQNVWTWITGDGDAIVPGKCFVNRFLYFICEVPFPEGVGPGDVEYQVNMENDDD